MDFAWPEVKIGLEVDGFGYHSDRRAFADDRQRDIELQLAGWRIVRVAAADALYAPDATCDVIARLLGRRRLSRSRLAGNFV